MTPLRWLRLWFDDTTVARVFEPLVADWQHDVATARSAADARRRWVAGFTALVVCAVRLAPRACVSDAAGTGRLVATVLFATVVIPAVAMVGPYFRHGPVTVGWLLPPIVASALPFALVLLAMRLAQWPVAVQARKRLFVRWVMLALGLQAVLLAVATPPVPATIYLTAVVAPAVYAGLGWQLGRQLGPIGMGRLVFWWFAVAATSGALWSTRRTLGVPLEAAALLPLCFALLLTTLLALVNAAHDDGRVSPITRQIDTSLD